VKPLGSGTRRQLYILAALAAVLILAVVKWGGQSSSSDAPSRPATAAGPAAPDAEERRPAARPRARSAEKKAAAEDVPIVTKDMLNPLRGRTGEAGRNIFDFRAPTVPPPPTPTPAPPPPPAPGNPLFVGPLPPPGPTPTPVPPPINFKFFGTFGPKDEPIAVLREGDQLLNARAGDVVFGKYILRSIGYESVQIGYVGYPPSVTTRLGITP
jgi:hypothetical protein